MTMSPIGAGGRPSRAPSYRQAARPPDHVNRRFRAPRPDMLRVSDFTCVATW